jgi:hypothetical protein|uniref:Uncharacterized protein n=1 Tax=Picea sitchensis TaxID=3332 RepID=A0A6B9XVY4_PICSI|nr:hypothetical protein Q903MT_gene4179 [Picea sitchensis]
MGSSREFILPEPGLALLPRASNKSLTQMGNEERKGGLVTSPRDGKFDSDNLAYSGVVTPPIPLKCGSTYTDKDY